MIKREIWERQFTRLLQQQLGLTPEQIKFHWRQYFNQRYSPEGAIAHLRQTHELYPELELLPVEKGAGAMPELSGRVV